MKNISTSIKLSLFTFICAIVFTFFSELTGILPLMILAFFSGCASIVCFIAWVCIKIFHKFKYSVNIILIIIFSSSAIATYLVNPETVVIQSLGDIVYASYITMAWIASVCACCISILALIARIIFSKSANESHSPATDSLTNEDNSVDVII